MLYGWEGTPLALSVATTTAAIFVAIGFLSPISCVALALLMRYADGVFQTGTLGTTVLIHVLMVLALLRAGRTLSFDRLLLRRGWLPQQWATAFTWVYHKPCELEFKSAYTLALVIYGTISFVALTYHLRDPHWTGGLTVKALFVSSYLCKQFEFFRSVDTSAPWLLGGISVAAGVAQSIFQFLMLPLMLHPIGRLFVKWHGMFFFLISLLFISLSFLPHWELLLWWIILFPKEPKEPEETCDDFLPSPSRAFYNVYALPFSVFVAWISWQAPDKLRLPKLSVPAATITRALGLEIPIVFNYVDLKMGDRWLVIRPGQARDVIGPAVGLSSKDGRRLNAIDFDILWANNHNSDRLYFGTSLPMRRRMIDLDLGALTAFLESGSGKELLHREILYHYRNAGSVGEVEYQVEVSESRSSAVRLFADSQDRHKTKVIYSKWFRFDGELLIEYGEAEP